MEQEESKDFVFRYKSKQDRNIYGSIETEFKKYLENKDVNCDYLFDEKRAVARYIQSLISSERSLMDNTTKTRQIYLIFKMMQSCSKGFFFYFLSHIYKENILFPGEIISAFLNLIKDDSFLKSLKEYLNNREFTREIEKVMYESNAIEAINYVYDILKEIAEKEIDAEQLYALKALSLVPEKAQDIFIEFMDDWDDEVRELSLKLLSQFNNKKAALKAIKLYKKEKRLKLRAYLRQIILNARPIEELIQKVKEKEYYVLPILSSLLSKEQMLLLKNELPKEDKKIIDKYL